MAPLAALLLATALILHADLDRSVSRVFFSPVEPHWPQAEREPWRGIYRFGELPGLALAAAGLALAVIGWRVHRSEQALHAGIFLVLTFLIGPGLVVNGLVKPLMMRPRPVEIVDFAGKDDFAPVGQRGAVYGRKSFPSGHASMGFYLATPALILCRRRPRLALAIAAAGLACGVVIGLGRMVEGKHFLSDILWAGALVYFSALASQSLAPLLARRWTRQGRQGADDSLSSDPAGHAPRARKVA